MPLFAILGQTPDFSLPLMGFMDAQGNVKIEPQFQKGSLIEHFSEAGYAVVQRPGAKQQIIIDAFGDQVFEFPKDHKSASFTPPDEHGIFGVMHQVDAENKDLWQLDGRDYVFHGETRYHAMRFDGSIAFDAYISQSLHGKYVFSNSSKSNEKRGVMDHEGQVVVPPIYDAIYLSRTDPYATVMKEGQANVLALDGSPMFARAFDIRGLKDLRHVEHGLWIVANSAKGRAEVFDVASAAMIGHLPMTYWSPMIPVACPTLSGGVVCINDAQKGSTYYCPDGRAAMPGILGRPRWFKPDMRTGYFNDGRAAFLLGGVWGYLDLAGKHAIAPQFKSNLPFRNGLVRVQYPADGKSLDNYSYVDREGGVVWHPEV